MVESGEVTQLTIEGRFHDLEITFANGSRGVNVDVPSASPLNFYQVINDPDAMPAVTLDGKLFLPPNGEGPHPVVILVPGSLGVAPSHVQHAETLNEAGLATFVLDTFGARSVTSTVANQVQFSFAASGYDVLAAYRTLAALPQIDAKRIGAQGHSRGGSAVMTAATRRFADPVIGPGEGLAGVLAAYPWCGQQFLDPAVGRTRVYVVMGDADEWCSPTQAQAHCHAIRLTRGDAHMLLVGGAQHSFDRDTPLELLSDAAIAPTAPIVYIADNGAMIHPLASEPDPALVDYDVMVYSMKSGFAKTGAHIGSAEGEATLFRNAMCGFWKETLGV